MDNSSKTNIDIKNTIKSDVSEAINNIIASAETYVLSLKESDYDSRDDQPSKSSLFAESNNSTESQDSQLQESDREILLKYFVELKEKFPKVQKINKLLNFALGEYFSRKKLEKAFYELKPEEIKYYTERYEKNLEEIYKMKQQKQFLLEVNQEEKLKKVKERDEALDKKNESKKDFLEIIQSTAKLLETSGQPVSEKMIQKLFNRFQRVHNELSKVRYEFIKTQNSLLEIAEKEKKLDDLGDGFKVFDYENMKTELQTVTSNIDTKNEELEKMRMRYKKNNQQFKNYRQSRNELENKLKELEVMLNKNYFEKEILAKTLDGMKKERELLNDEMTGLSIKAQLLTKTKLMLEYDKMEEGLDRKQNELSLYQADNLRIEKLIRECEEKMKNFEDRKKDSDGQGQNKVKEVILYEEKPLKFCRKFKNDKFDAVVKESK